MAQQQHNYSSGSKSPNSVMEERIVEMVEQCLALRKRKLADLYEQKTAECSLSYLIRHLLRTGKYSNLLAALQSEDSRTECVLLPRTVDGRIFINGKKYDAQTYFCRLWRFPNVKSRNQLEMHEGCANALEDMDNMCVNPYHFEKPLHPVPGGNRRPVKKVQSKASRNAANISVKTIVLKNKIKETVDAAVIENKPKKIKLEESLDNNEAVMDEPVLDSFKIESKHHMKNIGESLKLMDSMGFALDTELSCSDGKMKQNRFEH